MTRWELHVAKWVNCTRCELQKHRQRVVLAKGQLPCDILFLGEAPGPSEDSDDAGRPFIGPAGDLLESIIRQATEGMEPKPRIAYTNLVCCIPLDEESHKTDVPPDEAIAACAPRLVEFTEIADPKVLVAVGKTAEDFTDKGYRHSVQFHRSIPRVAIHHPAWILRLNVAQQGLEIRRCVVSLRNQLREVFAGKLEDMTSAAGDKVKTKPGWMSHEYSDDIPF